VISTVSSKNYLRRINQLGNRAGLLFVALLFCFQAPVSQAQVDQWHFSGVDRIVAVGDIHGAYDALVATLQKADVIDKKLAWSGGKTHFVITGDLLDRGPESRRVMDLIMRLEREAPIAGGRVHQLLGNHEVMNLIGDLRYVSDEEYAAFLDFETVEEREFWYQQFRSSKPVDSDEAAFRWEFDQKAPPGFFGHRRAFRHDGFYGKWLLEKPIMIVINDTAFVHGGVPPYVAERGLAGVNGSLKQELLDYVTTRAALDDAAEMSPIDRFKEAPAMLLERIETAQVAGEFLSSLQAVVDLSKSSLHGPASPTWYRGTASCSSLLEGDELDAALQVISAERVVFGHTTTVTRQVQQRMNGRVVEIDTGMLSSHYEGSGHALIIEEGELAVVNQNSGAGLWPIAHPVRVGHDFIATDDSALTDILANGVVAEVDQNGTTWKLVKVTADEVTVSAYFAEIPQNESYVPELAAFRLDRILGLGMVPVTVRREVEGQQGTLQFVPEDTMTERERVANGEGWSAPCPVEKQVQAMYVFDALIGNSARTPSSMLYSSADRYLLLVDHERSFSTDTGRPAYLKDNELAIGNEWRTRLHDLSNDVLRTELSDVLGANRLDALSDRRDALIKHSLGTPQ
jgi:hypothetical protein